MDWDYLKTVGVLAALTLLMLDVSDRWESRDWQGFKRHTRAREILAQWAVFMGLFLVASLILRKVWGALLGSICG